MLAFSQIRCVRSLHGEPFRRARIDGYDDGYGKRWRLSMGRKAKELGPLAILNALHQEDRNALVFASPRGGMLSGISLDHRAASDESRRRTAWLALQRPGLVRRTHELSPRSRRNGPGARHRRQGGSWVPARRSVREAALADEGLGRVLREPGNRQVAKAHGMAEVARRAELGKKTLFKALSENGNPTIATVHKVLHAVGLRLSVTPAPVRIATPTGV